MKLLNQTKSLPLPERVKTSEEVEVVDPLEAANKEWDVQDPEVEDVDLFNNTMVEPSSKTSPDPEVVNNKE